MKNINNSAISESFRDSNRTLKISYDKGIAFYERNKDKISCSCYEAMQLYMLGIDPTTFKEKTNGL